MPEAVIDRLNCRYELVFLLVKSRHYWFDLDSIRIPHATSRPSPAETASRRHRDRSRPAKYVPHARQIVAARRYGNRERSRYHPNGRNPGDVWSIRTRPYSGPHFAAFPAELPTRCVRAGCKPGGMALDPFCGIGTTGIAALALGRRFTGIDLNPEFAAIAAERLRQCDGQPDGTGNGTNGGNL
jgi:site-specific DNA-methyltransferase (cytosine-N4-specific)